MNDLNKLIIIGRLTRGAELKYTPSGASVTSFSVATNKSWKGKDGNEVRSAMFHSCILWGKRGESLAQYLEKGTLVYVEGELTSREWTGKDGQKKTAVEVNVQDIQMLGGKSEPKYPDGELL